ncbi:hypothetical protein ACN26Z_14830 [Verrucosispora sp. WMMD703]|uniref:hypothetical protein n=1 Tax=Verrucosispora sp. WMMD703 TaxID=3403463 RepID=UPI003B93BD14
MVSIEIPLPDEVAARLDAAARAGGRTTAATAAALLGEALDPAASGGVGRPYVVERRLLECPDCGWEAEA